MSKLKMTIGSGMLCLLLFGFGPAMAQNVTYSVSGECVPGQTVSIEFSSLPQFLVDKLEVTLEANQPMFNLYRITPEDRLIELDVAYEDMGIADLKSWLDSYLEIWQEEMHEDVLNN
jgi:hypothetical protein